MQVRVQNNNVSWDKVPTKDVIDYVIMTENKEKFQQFLKILFLKKHLLTDFRNTSLEL